ncbi:sensor histidine kinase [Chryseobacterium sp. GP-SGM7]|uniref:sensor histidine kinase n=1 Tax=Chryseobacterium sp. GP-SGM7 TaxID=3411323 RepID=UPI003B9480D4
MEIRQDGGLIVAWIWIGIGLLSLTTIFITAVILRYIKNTENNKRQTFSLIDKLQTEYDDNTLYFQEKDRERLAAELHDNIISRLNLLRHSLYYKDLNELHLDLKKSMQLIRNFTHQLTPPDLNEVDLTDLISDYLEEVRRSIFVDYHQLILHENSINNTIKLNTFRIFQELISNILKHADASVITVSLRISQKNIILQVKDNGKGFNYKEKTSGIGLQNIKLRTKNMDAHFKYKSMPQKGTGFIIVINIT